VVVWQPVAWQLAAGLPVVVVAGNLEGVHREVEQRLAGDNNLVPSAMDHKGVNYSTQIH